MSDKSRLPWAPYARPLSKPHDSGYLSFEVGYVGPNDSRVVLGRDVDNLQLPDGVRAEHRTEHPGCVVFWSKAPALHWETPVHSDAVLRPCERLELNFTINRPDGVPL